MLTRRTALLLGAAALAGACSHTTPGRPHVKRYAGPPITEVHIHKAKRRMYLISNREIVKKYRISLGGDPIGPKMFEGDGKTPEGAYMIDRRNWNSTYHLSLGISYPNEIDRARAEAMGRDPGGDIFIHGRENRNKGRGKDWTAGCIAVKDKQIEEIWSMVQNGTLVFIFP